jgi:hypothetical protein
MDYDLAAYFIFVAVVAFVLHPLSHRSFVVSFAWSCFLFSRHPMAFGLGGELQGQRRLSSHPTSRDGVYALPVTFVVGLPFVLLRRSRHRTRKPVKPGVMNEL